MDFIFHRQSGARVSDRLRFKDLTLVVLENDALRIVVLPEKGADIVAFVDKKSGVDVLLRLPAGLRSPKSEVALMDHPNTLFSYYEGGWQELFPGRLGLRQILQRRSPDTRRGALAGLGP